MTTIRRTMGGHELHVTRIQRGERLPDGVKPCYYTDLQYGRITPERAGQAFWLIDRQELAIYKPEPKPLADTQEITPIVWPHWDAPAPWSLRLKVIGAVLGWAALVALVLFDLYLVWLLWQRLEWLV